MNIEAIKTHRIECNESLEEILDRYISILLEESIVVVTSKIVSLCQGRVVAKSTCNKDELIKKESDAIVDTTNSLYNIYLTIKNHILIPSAGIDESNADDVYILYPEDLESVASNIWSYLRDKYHLNRLGVLITDSHTTPMRRGVTGIALGWCGFEPLHSYIGQPDIYGNPLRVTQINLIDALATSAVLVMGEGSEQTPLAMIKNAPKIRFQDRPPTAQEKESIIIPMEEDLYAPFLMGATWIKKGQ